MGFDQRGILHEVGKVGIGENDQILLQLVAEKVVLLAGGQGLFGQVFGDWLRCFAFDWHVFEGFQVQFSLLQQCIVVIVMQDALAFRWHRY